MKLPKTRQGCVELYEHRRETNTPMIKLDMYLGGLICCSKGEFLYRKPMVDDIIIGGSPCVCNYWRNKDYCHGDCVKNTEQTLAMPWDAPLYEREERYDD